MLNSEKANNIQNRLESDLKSGQNGENQIRRQINSFKI